MRYHTIKKEKRGCSYVFFVVDGCVPVGLIGACFLWLGYQNFLWNYYEHIFMENLKKYEGETR